MAGLRGRALAGQAALLVAAAALAALGLERGYGPHDEGLMLQWASRIAAGEWPYRDFWSNYGPGQPLLLAALWKAAGPSLVAWRILRVVLDAVTALLAFHLVRREAGARWALGAWAGVAAALAWPLSPGPGPTALLLAFAATLAARRSAPVAGAIAGAAALFRPEIGVAAALGAALVAPSRREAARALAAAAVAALLLSLPFLLVARGEMLGQVFGFASVQHLQRLPLVAHGAWTSDPNKLLEHLFGAVLIAGSALYAVALVAARPPRRALWPAPLVAVGAAYLLARPDEFHLVPLAPALAVALAMAAARAPAGVLRWALAVPLALVALHGLERRAGEVRHPPAQAPVPAAVADGVTTSPADAAALARLLSDVRRRAARGAPVLVAPPRYDRVRVGDPMLNVLLGRPNPTRYDVVQPGVVTSAAVQREMARDLGRSRTPVVVRWLDPTASLREPNASARSSGVTILDRVIARDYRAVARYGAYEVLARRRP